jgi:hypothetical protein
MVYVSVYVSELDCWLSYPLASEQSLADRLLALASDDLAEAA